MNIPFSNIKIYFPSFFSPEPAMGKFEEQETRVDRGLVVIKRDNYIIDGGICPCFFAAVSEFGDGQRFRDLALATLTGHVEAVDPLIKRLLDMHNDGKLPSDLYIESPHQHNCFKFYDYWTGWPGRTRRDTNDSPVGVLSKLRGFPDEILKPKFSGLSELSRYAHPGKNDRVPHVSFHMGHTLEESLNRTLRLAIQIYDREEQIRGLRDLLRGVSFRF